MKEKLAPLLSVTPQDLSIKATTTERLGFVGREEGIAALAVVLIESI
jgi:2-C-methyl-D-erythritol 2,4-cyclodiphosphate synthase